ncbi:MAG: riboflavin synthase [Verrucomicrobia bacterium]|nr:riboflavin synthase [Verrucomicrobiota bacterium]
MFTGIIEETGAIEKIAKTENSIRLVVRAKICARSVKRGDSIAVNGCCLTVIKVASQGRSKQLYFDLVRETWERTNLQFLQHGALVNLERALPANGRLGGHFVTGHIDGTGTIRRWERKGADHVIEIAAPPEILRYVVFKGSIAVDGISLTVAGVTKKSFQIWIIPHTHAVTALRERRVHDIVNLEADLLAKYAEKLFATCQAPRTDPCSYANVKPAQSSARASR